MSALNVSRFSCLVSRFSGAEFRTKGNSGA